MNNVDSSKTVKNNFVFTFMTKHFSLYLTDYKSFSQPKQFDMHALKGVLKG